MDDGPLSAEDFAKTARQELRAARSLYKSHLWRQSFQHAGFAVECALKARIMRHEGLNRWPDRLERRDLYVHDLQALATIAGLEPDLLRAVQQDEPVGLHWLVATDWRNDIRYGSASFPKVRARDMLRAVDDGGLISWILQI